jgi:hypothetical protein
MKEQTRTCIQYDTGEGGGGANTDRESKWRISRVECRKNRCENENTTRPPCTRHTHSLAQQLNTDATYVHSPTHTTYNSPVHQASKQRTYIQKHAHTNKTTYTHTHIHKHAHTHKHTRACTHTQACTPRVPRTHLDLNSASMSRMRSSYWVRTPATTASWLLRASPSTSSCCRANVSSRRRRSPSALAMARAEGGLQGHTYTHGGGGCEEGVTKRGRCQCTQTHAGK